MQLTKLAAVSVLALTAAACGSSAKTSAVVTGRLECPDRQGDLTRLSAAADGKTCVYSLGDSTEVTLRLIPVVNGDSGATLSQLEAQLKAEAQAPPTPATGAPAAASKAASKSADEAARIAAEAQADAAKAARDADEAQEKAADDQKVWDDKAIEAQVDAKLREKGIAVDSDKRGETTNVDLPGIHISADNDKADVHVGPIHVDASGDTATVRSVRDVRMRGEALSRTQRGIRAMFIYAGDHLANGYRYVGYEASGPRTGPLAVAIVKSRTDRGHGDIYGDVKRLVRRNGGT